MQSFPFSFLARSSTYYIFSRLCLTSSETGARSPFDLCHGYSVLCQNKTKTYHKHIFWHCNSIEYHNVISLVFLQPRPNTESGQGCRETNYLTRVPKTISVYTWLIFQEMSQNHILVTAQFSNFHTTPFNYTGQNLDTGMMLFDLFSFPNSWVEFYK